MMTTRSDGYDEDPCLYLFHIRFKSPVRPDWRCRGCVVIIDADDDDDVSDGYDEDLIFMFFIFDSKVSLDPIGDAEGA